METKIKKNILIIGGGFGGVKAAQILGRDRRCAVRLVDPKAYMEYHAATYRLTTGRSALEVCIPYTELLRGSGAEVVKDAVVSIDPAKKQAVGLSASTYDYDELILAIGCESSYFGIQGVEEHAYSINSVDDALKLRRHIHDSFEKAKTTPPEEKVPLLHVAVIGGGASGTELAGEFAAYTRSLAKAHGIDPSLVTIDLIEAMTRVLPGLPEHLSAKAHQRLRELGVNVYLNRSVVREEVDKLFLKDMQMTTKTVVWTAGLKANGMTATIPGLSLDKRGRVLVDDHLRALGVSHVSVIGDVASTKYSGMAQTALADAAYVAKSIRTGSPVAYVQPAPAYAVPVGPGYAVVLYHGMSFSGSIGWFLRRAADFRAFLSMLGLAPSIRAFLAGMVRHESCPVCAKNSGSF